MKSVILFSLSVVGFVIFSSSVLAQSAEDSNQAVTNSLVALKNAPVINGNSFCCESMVHAVNSLRHLGKDGALIVLRRYLEESGHPEAINNWKILIVCRILFVNPDGWKPPQLGMPYPEVNEAAIDKNQLFPIVLSHGVPFLMIESYIAGGYSSDTAEKCVKLCGGFNLITKDLPENGYVDAAHALAESQEFRTLYLNTNDLVYVERMILGQARCDDPFTRLGIKSVIKNTINVKISNGPQTNSVP